jgi:DNA polymerase-3 subunit alpha
MTDFTHLHNHSEYSLLDGLSRIEPMVKKAKELGMSSIAITDHGNLYGAIKFFQTCKKYEIKPIIGCEIYMAQRSLHDKEAGVDKDYNHLILLAKDLKGYKNLMKIISIAHLDGYYYKPRCDMKLLEKYNEGIICLTACLNGYVNDPLLNGNEKEAENRLNKLKEIFDNNRLYLEIQRHINVPRQEELNQKLIEISKKEGIPLVATNDNHYIEKDDSEAQEILLCIGTQTTIDTPNRKLSMIESPDFYIKNPKEMKELFMDIPSAVENTVKIAEMCNVEIELGKWIMPNFEVPNGMTPKDYLKKLIDENVGKRYSEITDEIKERIEYELSIINDKGYATYFLVVADFVNWAKDNDISVGPGRGSAAGSVVSYILRITDVDPFYFKLPFERFLNPQRPSAPDIDLDFADTKRDEVISYVTEKYGRDKVAQIITFGTMEAKGSIRDVGRALGMPYSGPDRISKMIPPGWQGHSITLDGALNQSPDLKRAYNTEEGTKRLIDLAKKLEGVARHASVHAAGVVIADKDITEYTPLQRETRGGKIITQYDMYTVGEDGVGLLKMDFLGLRNLTIIQEALRFIKENRNEKVDFSQLPLDDKKTYKLLASGENTGIFQLESAGMRRYIKELKPTSIFDLMAMVALYRPGPMQNIPDFIERKHNPEKITYPDPRLKEILKPSYGILTYQDDVLLTAIKLAGFSWLEADKLRKAVGKKIPAEMKKQRELFIEGVMKHSGLTRKKGEELFDLIAPFAGYGFNKAHAACYATIAYRTAYLKANYGVEFMTALLTAESRGTTGPAKNEKMAEAIAECKRLKINVLTPSVNSSGAAFSIENHESIRFGLSAIKNVGEAAISTILEARENKSFDDLMDFVSRVDLSKVNRKTLESLIKAGSFDEFGNRAMMLTAMNEIVDAVNKKTKKVNLNQESLFEDLPDESTLHFDMKAYIDIEEFSQKEKLVFERELLGFFLTDHPLNQKLGNLFSLSTHKINEVGELKDGSMIRIGGLISQIKKIFTKRNNEEMAFITVEDHVGASVECVVFPKVFSRDKILLNKDAIVLITGKLDHKDDAPVILVDNVRIVN